MPFPNFRKFGNSVFYILIAWVIASACYVHFFVNKTQVTLDIKVPDNVVTEFKIYWRGDGEGYSEKRSNAVRISKDSERYTMLIGDLGNTSQLRIDPLEYIGELRIDAIYIQQTGFEDIYLWNQNHWQKIKIVKQLNPFEYDKHRLLLRSTGTDGQLLLDVAPVRTAIFPVVHVVNIILLGLLIWMLGLLLTALKSSNQFAGDLPMVPAMVLGVLIVTTIMTAISNFNVHPDEKAHYKAVEYYNQNILPPAIDDPAVADSFSDFGYSRLSSYESYYPLAGYASRLMQPLGIPFLTNARLFNLFLLIGLLIFVICREQFRIFAIPLLVTPQAWYLFSYINSDAMALILIMLAAYQIANRQSALNQYLTDQESGSFVLRTLALGTLLGMLFLLKANNYFFLLFAGAYLLWRMVVGDFPDRKMLIRRLGLIVLVGFTLPLLRYGLDVMENGASPGKKHAAMIEKHSEYLYRPSTALENKHINLYMKERGVSLDHMLHYRQWPQILFSSSFGSYGYLQYPPSKTLYSLFQILSIAMLWVLVYSVLVRAPPRIQTLLLIVLVCSFLLVLTSLWRSWTVIFQPQGRYLTPILAMAGVLLYHTRHVLNSRVFYPLVFAMFALSVYSFIFIGINQVSKTNYETERPLSYLHQPSPQK